jgi:hypothetical protein
MRQGVSHAGVGEALQGIECSVLIVLMMAQTHSLPPLDEQGEYTMVSTWYTVFMRGENGRQRADIPIFFAIFLIRPGLS